MFKWFWTIFSLGAPVWALILWDDCNSQDNQYQPTQRFPLDWGSIRCLDKPMWHQKCFHLIVSPSLIRRHSKGKERRILGAGEARSNSLPLPFTKCVQLNCRLCGSYSNKSFGHIWYDLGSSPLRSAIRYCSRLDTMWFVSQGSSVICSNTLISITLKFAMDSLTKIICYLLTA